MPFTFKSYELNSYLPFQKGTYNMPALCTLCSLLISIPQGSFFYSFTLIQSCLLTPFLENIFVIFGCSFVEEGL